MKSPFLLGASVACALISGPAMPDIITFDGETYAGRITSVTTDEVIFDLECAGELYAIPTSSNVILEFAEGCGGADIPGTGGGWQLDICYDEDHFGAPPVFWDITLPGGDGYWGEKVSLSDESITLHWKDGTSETFPRTNVRFDFYDLDKFLASFC